MARLIARNQGDFSHNKTAYDLDDLFAVFNGTFGVRCSDGWTSGFELNRQRGFPYP